MIAKNLISSIVGPLSLDDTGEQSLSIMNVYHLKELPLVNKKEFLCLVTENFLLENNLEQKLSEYKFPYVNPFCYEEEHLFEIIQKMSLNKQTSITVLNKDHHFVGIVTMEDIIHFLGQSYSFSEPGSIIILETTRQNYSLAEVSRIAESEGVLIFFSFVNANQDNSILYVTLKLNTFDITRVVNAFQRYEYTINAAFSEEEYIDALKERYDSLMKYLSI